MTKAGVRKYDKEKGKEIKRIRNELGWTVNVLSNKTGVSRAYLYQIENDGYLPSEKVLMLIDKAFKQGIGLETSSTDRTLGDNMKYYRRKLNLSLDKLSELTGMSISNLCFIEKNKTYPKISTIEKISIALGVTIDQLKKDTKIEMKDRNTLNIIVKKDEFELIGKYRELSKEDRSKIRELLNKLYNV
ncbi:MAG: helix-turn-helix transcriptional regulator [Cetobacterium sp.]|uniref:helix-turn-helix transcriptional regulator n=1 Tax=Bacteria TaxID=2 RepID=UPI002FCC335F